MLVLKYGKFLNKNVLMKHVLPIANNRSYCDFAHKWMPGPYPRTKEEHDAAAKKYNLIPEDYKPCPEDQGMGDYPDIHRLSHQQDARPYWMDYDEPFMRRNYGEPLSQYFNPQEFEPPVVEVPKQHLKLMRNIVFGFLFFIIFAAFGPEHAFHKAKPKQYPPEYFLNVRPKVHYSFEEND